jgi:uncharacterized protein
MTIHGQKLIGREPEQRILAKTLASSDAELVAVYGRRRVGKTFLVREFFRDQLCFELTGVRDAPLAEQLQNFANAFGQSLRIGVRPAAPANWQEAFEQLTAFLASLQTDRKWVVFFDEIPWLASRRSRFLAALDHFWNSWASRQRHLIVVICGSAASWMIHKVIQHRGGLHNRVTQRIRLEPFTLGESFGYLRSRGVKLEHRQVLELYLALGGIAHYLKQVEPGRSAAQNIDDLCFSPTGALADEFGQLYASLFEHPEQHVKIIRALNKKRRGLTRNEILQAAGIRTGGGSTAVLDELTESGFVLKTLPFAQAKKESLYRLADEYSMFYLTWMEGRRSSGPDLWMKRQASPAWRAWSGCAFEGLCLKHARQLKRALGIAGVETTESAWSHRGTGDRPGVQVDLVIDRRDDCINLCEMKYSQGEFVIDRRYAEELRTKREVFREVTKTRKTLFLTLVTAFGVRDNAYARELVDHAITMHALFE